MFARLRRFLILLSGDLDLAAGILKETQITPFIGPSLGRHDRAFQMKLYKVAYQKIMEVCEQAASKSAPIAKFDSNDVCLSGAAKQLLQEFQRLPLGAKAAMALVVIERWSIDETAAIMETSPQQIRKNLLGARRKISPDLWRQDYPVD